MALTFASKRYDKTQKTSQLENKNLTFCENVRVCEQFFDENKVCVKIILSYNLQTDEAVSLALELRYVKTTFLKITQNMVIF